MSSSPRLFTARPHGAHPRPLSYPSGVSRQRVNPSDVIILRFPLESHNFRLSYRDFGLESARKLASVVCFPDAHSSPQRQPRPVRRAAPHCLARARRLRASSLTETALFHLFFRRKTPRFRNVRGPPFPGLSAEKGARVHQGPRHRCELRLRPDGLQPSGHGLLARLPRRSPPPLGRVRALQMRQGAQHGHEPREHGASPPAFKIPFAPNPVGPARGQGAPLALPAGSLAPSALGS